MIYSRLGHSDLEVSAVALGCWQFGGGGWKDVTDEDSIRTARSALDAGINLFDTAEVYGKGRSEEVLGRALAGRRDEAIIATKVSHQNATSERLMEHLDQSLARLGTDRVDLYQLHWPTRQIPIEETMAALDEAISAGKVRYVGVSNFSAEELAAALGRGKVVSLQPPYSLFWRFFERDARAVCLERSVGVIAYSPLAQGLLTGKYTAENRPDPDTPLGGNFLSTDEETYLAIVGAVEKLRALAEAKGVTLAQLAVAWTVAQPAVTAAIVGARRPEQARTNAAAADVELSADELAEIDRIGRTVTGRMEPRRSMWGWYPDKHLDEQEGSA